MAPDPPPRGRRDTADRRYWLLLVLSGLVHVLLTPIGAWLGLLPLLLSTHAVEAEPGPEDRFEEVPIEIFESEPEPAAAKLPSEDPVEVIDELIESPQGHAADDSKAQPPARQPPPPVAPTATTPIPEPSSSARPVGAAPSASGSSSTPPASTQPPAEDTPPNPPPMRNPVAFEGEASTLKQPTAYVGVVIYLDRVRRHPAGRRIESILPRLPQWRDFFAAEEETGKALNPVQDFDRIHMVGPSFYDSSQVVAQLQYNTSRAKVKAAIDRLVRRRGRWVQQEPPVAHAFADRAERVFIMRNPKTVVVVPPQLEKQVLALKRVGVPNPQGAEALVASTKNPHKPLGRVGLNIPKSVRYATVRLTPLAGGSVYLELEAEDESAEAAAQTANQVTRDINAAVDMLSGLTSVLSQFGFGGGVKLPRVNLHSQGSKILGEITLNQRQVDFLLDRVERQLISRSLRRERPTATSSKENRLSAPAAPSAVQKRE